MNLFDRGHLKLFLPGILCLFLFSYASAQEIKDKAFKTTSLQLTQDERLWLKDHPVIRVATDPGWRPIEFQDGDGEFKGIAIDYLKRIEPLLGIQFDIVKGNSWAELIEKGKARELDMFSCITPTPDRGEYLLFTEPYLSFPAAIFTRNDAPYVGNLRELANEKVAVVNGYAFHELLELNHPEIDLIPVDSTQTGLQMLEEGEVEAYVGNLLVASYHITTRGSISLKVAGETPYRNNLGFATRSDWPELTILLQKALDSLSAEDKRAIYTNWVSLSYEHKYDVRFLLQITAAIVAVFAFILLVIQQRQLRIRKKTMLDIAQRKAEFEAVFNAMADSLVMTDIERNVVMTNKAFSKTFGYSSIEVIGNSAEMLYVDAQEYKQQGEMRYSSDAQSNHVAYEMNYRRKDGSIFPGETIGVKVTDASGTLTGFLRCIRDITERKQVEEQLLHNDRMKSEFIATASHELRTPLTSILGYAELLLEDSGLTPKLRKEGLEYIVEKGHLIERMVTDMLDVSRIESGRMLPLERTMVDISEVVDHVFKEFEQESANCILCLQFPDQGLPLFVDKDRMLQVFENLVGNAIKFSPNGGQIIVKGETVDGNCLITVADEGIGINSEQQEHIFEKFHRVDSSNTATKGLGLGLYLVKIIIEAHHGKVWVESNEGKGVKFIFTLPLDNQKQNV